MELFRIYTVRTTMRRLFLIILITLLPLRTWAGDVMAVDMASNGLTSSALTSAQPANTAEEATAHHQMPAANDCEWHAGASPTEATTQVHCSTCVTCQICHSVVILTAWPNVTPPALLARAPAIGAPRFTSAEPAQSQKPPIA